jgi:hypothetical protein
MSGLPDGLCAHQVYLSGLPDGVCTHQVYLLGLPDTEWQWLAL